MRDNASSSFSLLFATTPGGGVAALSVALTELDPASKISDDSTSDARTTEKIDRALGQAVARCWSKFVPKIQQTLFEAAVQAEGENVRQALAIHLHDKHERTAQS